MVDGYQFVVHGHLGSLVFPPSFETIELISEVTAPGSRRRVDGLHESCPSLDSRFSRQEEYNHA